MAGRGGADSCAGEVEGLDRKLVALARDESALRLRLGQALEVLGRGGHFELGFSSLSAYALERCERNARWVEGARGVARRLSGLPALRSALARAEISWGKAELVARVADAGTEGRWLREARTRTVRELRGLVRAAANDGASTEAVDTAAEGSDTTGAREAGEAPCTLSLTMDHEEHWLFEATRALLDGLGTPESDAQVEALLAEAQGALLESLPPGRMDWDAVSGLERAQSRWREQLQRWRTEAEAYCGGCAPRGAPEVASESDTGGETWRAAALGGASLEGCGPRELDAVVRGLTRELSGRELELARNVLEFHDRQGWGRLGYATEAQYARERLGMSRSSWLARCALGRRLGALPRLAEALGQGRLGVEAAQLVARVATARTVGLWIDRAERRTIKHLREEVEAARVARRLSDDAHCPPPSEGELDAFHELQRAALSGKAWAERGPARPAAAQRENSGGDGGKPEASEGNGACDGGAGSSAPRDGIDADAGRGAWHRMLASLARWLERGVRMSAGEGAPGAEGRSGRVTVKLRVSEETRSWWRALEREARRWLPRGVSWLRFACISVWRAWGHLLGADVAYGRIYIRERCRCASPVCVRRDVTPHHLQFRSAGGGEEESNLVAVCSWCHLRGIHGGRIRARGRANRIRWELGAGRAPCIVVEARERVAA